MGDVLAMVESKELFCPFLLTRYQLLHRNEAITAMQDSGTSECECKEVLNWANSWAKIEALVSEQEVHSTQNSLGASYKLCR